MQLKPVTSNMILYCKEWSATVCFYRDRLMLPINLSTDWFVEFSLNNASRLSIADEKHTSIKGSGGSGVAISLQVEDIDHAWKYAQATDLAPAEIRMHPWGARVFNLFDPEGHRIEIWQSLITDKK